MNTWFFFKLLVCKDVVTVTAHTGSKERIGRVWSWGLLFQASHMLPADENEAAKGAAS